MFIVYVIAICIILAAWYGITERSWREFFECSVIFVLGGILIGVVLTLLGSGVSMAEAKPMVVAETDYTVYSLNEVFGDSYEEDDYILFKDNELYVYVKDNDSGIVIEKELADNVKICYSNAGAGVSLTEREFDYANAVLRHLFWQEYLPESIVEIPEGSLIIPYGDMFIKEAK